MSQSRAVQPAVPRIRPRGLARRAWLLAIVVSLLPLAVYAESIRFSSAEATFHRGDEGEFLKVIDGVEFGPAGWSPAPKAYEPQSLVVRCARPVEADELDVSLFFMAGRPWNALAEFALSFTTDAEPSLRGNWQPLEITRFAADVNNLRRTPEGSLRLDFFSINQVGNHPDDVYRLTTRLPGGRATGFRLDAIPVPLPGTETRALSWWPPHDFTLTEFRVAVHVRETTNIALHQPASASHALYDVPGLGLTQKAGNLTDGLPATFAHPKEAVHGADFFFEIDLGRVVDIDHIGLRNRGDEAFDRMGKLRVRMFEQPPAAGNAPSWEALARADGTSPPPGAVEMLRAGDGHGEFRGRFLRISSESTVPVSPQLAEVEVYEARTPVLVSALADGEPFDGREKLVIPPGRRRLAMELRIPQIGRPPGDAIRWRVPGEIDAWQSTPLMTIDMACPRAGAHVFEAQALHSDNQWDATVLRLPMVVRQHPWENRTVQAIGFALAILAAIFLSRRAVQRRTERQMAAANARAALAEERSRIARNMHDDVGARLARLAVLQDVFAREHAISGAAAEDLAALTHSAREAMESLDEAVWTVNPRNDTLAALAAFLVQHADHYLAPLGIACRIDGPGEWPEIPLRAGTRHEVAMAFKEALQNVVKHAAASEVELGLRHQDGEFVLRVADNGRGFSSASAGPGRDGLLNMRQRLESIGGTCAWLPREGGGTIVVMKLPLP